MTFLQGPSTLPDLQIYKQYSVEQEDELTKKSGLNRPHDVIKLAPGSRDMTSREPSQEYGQHSA